MNNKDSSTESENNHQMKVFLPTKLLESLPRTSTLPKERLRWNTNEEIASYLISFDRHEEWLSCTLKARPQNGSILLYNRKKVQYRKDGYCWKKRKDGKTTREDHMKLKVQGTECLYGCYVHSSIIPTFHRRCYWLLQNPDIVLVHYLNVPSVEDSGKVCGPVLCAVTDRRDGLRWSREDLLSQLKPMFHSMKWGGSGSGAELSTEQLVQQILESQQTKPQPRTHTCLCNHASPGVNIPHRCNSTKHRIISPKLPTRPSPYPALTEVQNLTSEGVGGGASREAGLGDVPSGGVASERGSSPLAPDSGSMSSPSASSSPPQTQRAATIALSNGSGFYGDQRSGLATVALPQNAVIVMTTTAALGRGGEESKAELSLTRAGSRLVLSPVPPKQDTPPPPTATSPTSPAPPPHTTSPNQGVATLSLTLLPSPVIGGLLLTDRIISDPPSAMLHAPAPCLLAPPTMSAGSASALLPFDPDSFLNSPKQGQTYGGSSLTPPIPANSASSCPSPPLSSSPEPLASLALSLSPTSPPSSLSTPSSSSLSPSLSFSLSSSCSDPTLPSLCLDPSLGLDSLTQPLSPSLDTQDSSPLDVTHGSSSPGYGDGQDLLSGQDNKAPPTPLSLRQLQTNQLLPTQKLSNQHPGNPLPLNQMIPNQLLPKQQQTNQMPADGERAELRQNHHDSAESGVITHTHSPGHAYSQSGVITSHACNPGHKHTQSVRHPGRGLRHSLSQPALHTDSHTPSCTHTDTHTPSYTHTDSDTNSHPLSYTHTDLHTPSYSHADSQTSSHTHTDTLMHTHSAHSSPVRLKEEKSPPITPSILQDFESDETPMDTAHSSDAVPPDTEEPELSFDSTFPDLISELITEETNTQSSGFCQIPSLATPTFPIRYMVPPQPMPATSYLPYPTLTHTHTHTHSGAGEGAVCLASITDFSPEWSYPEGGVKVLITGPWSQESVRYSCVFDQSTVPASLIQAGVLRCYCPAHEAGLVALRVMKGSDTVSSSVLFEYRARNATSLPSSQLDWLSLDDNQFRMSILERLEQMERRMAEMANSNQQQQQQHLARQQSLPASSTRLTPENQAGPWFERRIVSVCERMMQTGSWGCGGRETLTHSITHRGMTLLHLAAAQGYTQLIHTLIRWRGVGPASVSLEQEIDPLNVDHFSCTPLMWACALGHQTAAVLLYSWSSVALGIPDSLGRLPLAVARARGHTRLVHCLEELHTQKQAQELTHTLDTSAPPLLPTSPVSTSPDTGLSSSSSVPSPSDPPSPSPSSAYSSGSLHPSSPLSSPSDPMDTSSNSSPHNSPGLWDHAQEGGGTNDASGSSHNHFLMNAPSHPRSEYPHPSFETELLSYSENTENEHFLPADIIQVDMATLAEQIIEATPERIKQEDFPRGAESPLRERRDNPAIHDTLPWLAPYLDNIDSCVSPTPQFPSPLSSLALQRIRPPSSAAWAEFLNASANGRMERDFALLTLTDSEQRELYEAARIIQNAFRRYKGRRQKEQQDMAAAVIQRCYRKYKQLTWIALKYALYKKMTQAAILIQSKFRSYYEQKRFQQSRRAAVLIQQYYRSYKEYERLKQGSFLTKKQDQAARKIMRFFRRCRHRIKELKQSRDLERRGITT
ncbi:calmodulin-binding transcription activator 2 isoform X2 [Electrophorus electricus]|uniref:calmodulin-binding transcription activator 2 isoform X2 n=1 Tax=Electrophorus electricus TaxID=8005 RepID=UPI0015D00520|nr:calmodulin-binding transcription activator 2 isoform X2 [Electrophorus electricus]